MADDFTVPDLAEPITGHRLWTADDDGNLTSPSFAAAGGTWPTGRALVATCGRTVLIDRPAGTGSVPSFLSSLFGTPTPMPCGTSPSPVEPGRRWLTTSQAKQILDGSRHPSAAPHNGHGCGIYAFKSRDGLLSRERGFQLHRHIAGTVALSGRVYEYSHGYRAEKATVTGIYLLPGQPKAKIQAIADRYGVPVLELTRAERRTARSALRHEARVHASCCNLPLPLRDRIVRTARPWLPLTGAVCAWIVLASSFGAEAAGCIVFGAVLGHLIPDRSSRNVLRTWRSMRVEKTTRGR